MTYPISLSSVAADLPSGACALVGAIYDGLVDSPLSSLSSAAVGVLIDEHNFAGQPTVSLGPLLDADLVAWDFPSRVRITPRGIRFVEDGYALPGH